MSGYTLTKRAYTDLLNIWIYIAEDNFDAADRMWDDLEQAMRDLARMPGMGHRRRDVKNSRYRFWSVHSYTS